MDRPQHPWPPLDHAEHLEHAGDGHHADPCEHGKHADGIAARLQREWMALARRPGAIAAARSWAVTDRRFDDLDGLLVLAGHRLRTRPATEEVLRRLLAVAAEEELAGRIVVQRLLPGLLGIVRRRSRGHGSGGLLEELVGAAWITIRTWDLERQPGCLAAALLWTARHRAFGSSDRRRSSTEAPFDGVLLDEILPDAVPSALDELTALLCEARQQGLDDEDVAFVRRFVHADSATALAAAMGVTPRTIRNRRDRVTYRLRRVALAA